MDKTLTAQFVRWLDDLGIELRREVVHPVDLDEELPGLMERSIDEWFAPAKIRQRSRDRAESGLS